MKIVKLQAENFKRLVAVEITPAGDVVKITGKNGAGKSSILDAIWAALGGKDAAPGKPIRAGASKSEITLDLGELIVRRTFTEKSSTLFVTNAQGLKYSTPQAVLDALVGRLTFDPLDFMRMKPADQAEALQEIAGLNFAQLELDRHSAYQERTTVNADVKRLTAQLSRYADLGDWTGEELSIAVLSDQLQEELQVVARDGERRQKRDGLQNANSLKIEEIKRLEARKKEIETEISAAHNDLKTTESMVFQLDKEIAKMPDRQPTIDDLRGKIKNAETHNAQVRDAHERDRLRGELETVIKDANRLSEKIAELDYAKIRQISDAPLPIEGLGLDEKVVTYQGLPLAQASQAEQLRVSMAMAMAANPKLRIVRITDGSLLDSASMAAIAEMATAHDFQVWIEVVDETGEIGFYIEDGQVKQTINKGESDANGDQ